MLPHLLTNFDKQKYCELVKRFDGIFNRNRPPFKMKNEMHVVYLDEYLETVTHSIAL